MGGAMALAPRSFGGGGSGSCPESYSGRPQGRSEAAQTRDCLSKKPWQLARKQTQHGQPLLARVGVGAETIDF